MARVQPVILVGIDTPIGLAIIRELGSRGVAVHGLARNPRALGIYSRYLRRAYVREPGREALIEQVVSIAAVAGCDRVMAVSEEDIVTLNAARPRLMRLKLLIPEGRQMELALDKSRTAEIARSVGIDVPQTWSLRDLAELDRLTCEFRYPLILKWKNPLAAARRLEGTAIPFERARYCRTETELRQALVALEPLDEFPLIQEYCSGHGLGQFLFMIDGAPLLRFQHRRIHEWPPEGGFSTVCEAIPRNRHVQLMERSSALLRAMDWRGAAMVEYRYDPRSRRACLMEVNGRFWGSLPLAYHCGAPFAWLTYRVLGDGERPALDEPRSGLRARYMIPETRRLWRVLFERHKIQDPALGLTPLRDLLAYLAAFLDPRTRYYVLCWRDPLPFLMDLWFVLRKGLGLRA